MQMTQTKRMKRIIQQAKTDYTNEYVKHQLRFYYEQKLALEVSKIFAKMEKRILQELHENYNPGVMYQAQVDMILSPIHELHREYFETILKYQLKEYDNARATGRKIVKYKIGFKRKGNVLPKTRVLKADLTDAVSSTIIKDELFGTLDVSHYDLEQRTYALCENTLRRVDSDINNIVANGYREGMGIDKVGRDITNRFGQLKTWEANRIARTEIHISHNQGLMQGYYDMDVEYLEWSTSIDGRERDSHRELNGEIIPIGGTFSNDLHYPGDSSGIPSEIINCRCQALPFIMPYGYIAPPGMTRFRESDLVPTLDYFNADELISQATQTARENAPNYLDAMMEEFKRSVPEWDINRLTPAEKEIYLKSKQNYLILKDAIEKGDYSKLDDLIDDGLMEITDKKSFLTLTENGKDLEIAKIDLEDYLMDIEEYEKIIKDTNIQVTIEPKTIKWNRSDLGSNYVNLNDEGKYEAMNLQEKFIKYHFKKENLTIYESVDMDYSRMRRIYEAYKDVPDYMKRAKEIVLSNQVPVQQGLFSDSRLGGYVLNKKGSARIYQFKRNVEDLKGNLRHELAHLLERDSEWFISNSKEYIDAFYADMDNLKAMGYLEEETYVTPYSHSFTTRALNRKEYLRPFSEDFAESVKYYLKDPEQFSRMYPNKAKVIKKAINGELTSENTINYWNWKKQNYVKFELTEKEYDRYVELGVQRHLAASNGQALTKAEQEELQYYEDKKTFDYIFKKVVTKEKLSDDEVQEFMRLQKKYNF